MLMPSLKVCASAAVLTLSLPLLASPGYGQSGPFAGMAGNWSGSGTITTTGGSERIRCRVRYIISDGGMAMQQELRCASDSYRFDVSSSVAYRGDGISGTWSESTRGVSGNVIGRARSGSIAARVDGPGFSASLSIQTSGQSQSVSIKPQGADITSVAVNLRRG
ncbi:MAG TPA: hypothetical protein VEM36_01930, partial [Xanthobacteraceae bacterium]|nr:hypothetical protein [Xanthobacteraceae bacterium]